MADDIEVEVVLQARASVGEGPVWDERTDSLVSVDIRVCAQHVQVANSTSVHLHVHPEGLRQVGDLDQWRDASHIAHSGKRPERRANGVTSGSASTQFSER